MNSNKVTAIATSVIAICAVGFVVNGVYNSTANKEKRCINIAQKIIEEGPPEGYFEMGRTLRDFRLSIWDDAKKCVERANK